MWFQSLKLLTECLRKHFFQPYRLSSNSSIPPRAVRRHRRIDLQTFLVLRVLCPVLGCRGNSCIAGQPTRSPNRYWSHSQKNNIATPWVNKVRLNFRNPAQMWDKTSFPRWSQCYLAQIQKRASEFQAAFFPTITPETPQRMNGPRLPSPTRSYSAVKGYSQKRQAPTTEMRESWCVKIIEAKDSRHWLLNVNLGFGLFSYVDQRWVWIRKLNKRLVRTDTFPPGFAIMSSI